MVQAYKELLTEDKDRDRPAEFLEKIIQVSYTLAAPQTARLDAFVNGLLEVKVEKGDQLAVDTAATNPDANGLLEVKVEKGDQLAVDPAATDPDDNERSQSTPTEEPPRDVDPKGTDQNPSGQPLQPPQPGNAIVAAVPNSRKYVQALSTTAGKEEKDTMRALVQDGLLTDKSLREVKQLHNHFTLAKCILTAVSKSMFHPTPCLGNVAVVAGTSYQGLSPFSRLLPKVGLSGFDGL